MPGAAGKPKVINSIKLENGFSNYKGIFRLEPSQDFSIIKQNIYPFVREFI